MRRRRGSDVEACRHCGEPKRADTWCATAECADRVAAAQQEAREWMFGVLPSDVRGTTETKGASE